MEAKPTNAELQRYLRPALYIASLVMAHLALATLAIRLLTTGMDRYLWPRWQSVLVEGVALSQVGLMAVWLAVGSTGLPLRITACTLATGLWLAILNYAGLDHEYWLPLLLLLAMANAGVLYGLSQTWSFRLRHQLALEQPQSNANRAFTLRQTFAWTTAIAALLAFGTLAQQFAGVQTRPEAFSRAMIMGFMLVPVMLTSTWATLGTNRRLLASVVLLFAVVAASLSVGRYDEAVRTTRWSSLDWMAYTRAYWYLTYLYSIIVVVSLLVIRWCGYALVPSGEDAALRVSLPTRGSPQTLVVTAGVVLLALLGLGQVRVAFNVSCILFVGFTVMRARHCHQSGQPRGMLICICAMLFVALTLLLARWHNIPALHLLTMTFPVLRFFHGAEIPMAVLLAGLSVGNLIVVLSPLLVNRVDRGGGRAYGVLLAAAALCSWAFATLYPQFFMWHMHLVWCVCQTTIAVLMLWPRTSSFETTESKTTNAVG